MTFKLLRSTQCVYFIFWELNELENVTLFHARSKQNKWVPMVFILIVETTETKHQTAVSHVSHGAKVKDKNPENFYYSKQTVFSRLFLADLLK